MDKKKFIIQGISLAFLGLAMKGGNVFYRSYLSQKIGAEGMGLYQLIFSIFILSVTLCTSGISIAVTRLISSAVSQNKTTQIRSIVNKSLLFCLVLSLVISSVFFFCSDFLATELLGNKDCSNCLKILGVGLPFMSLCTCSKGYFLAVNEAVSSSVAEIFEQVLTIGLTVVIFVAFPFDNIETACLFAMVASTIGEIGSFLINLIELRFSLARNTPERKTASFGVMRAMAHIALPCTFSSAARSLLSSLENLLIPRQLQKYGFSYSEAMAEYGLLQGMALPVLYFPSAFIAPFAVLLIPKICKDKELEHKKAVAYITNKAICSTVSFGVIMAGVFFCCSDVINQVFYGSNSADFYIYILAPLVPLMYLDIVVDCLLKALDQQLVSMKYNIIDSTLRVSFIFIFMGIFGMNAYVCILFFSTIFNASLSLGKLIKVTKPKFDFVKKLTYQIPIMIISVNISQSLNVFANDIFSLAFLISCSFVLYYLLCFITNKFLAKNGKQSYNNTDFLKDGILNDSKN